MGGGFTYSVILTQLIPHFENVDWDRTSAAFALSTMAGFGIAGKLMFGFLSEKITARRAFILSLWVQAVGLTGITVAGSSQLAWGAIPIFGIGFGGMGALIPLTVGETFGYRSFGVIMGVVHFASIPTQVIAPVIAGVVFDATDSYTLVFSVIVGFYLLGSAALFAAKPAPSADAA
jgi:cyanate permease